MDAVAAAELVKYDEVWRDHQRYRAQAFGLDLWLKRREIFPPIVESAVDLGCGHGRLVAHWLAAGMDALGVDFSREAPDPEVRERWGHCLRFQCLWDLDLGREFQLGVCADVMEHIPEAKVDETLRRIQRHVGLVVFLIANYSSRSLGHDLHPTMRPAPWWGMRLNEMFSFVEILPYGRSGREAYLFRCLS